MRQVIIGIDKNGKPYVKSCPKKVEVIFKEDKKPTFRKRYKTALYQVKSFFKGAS